jgi:hypothetical protein
MTDKELEAFEAGRDISAEIVRLCVKQMLVKLAWWIPLPQPHGKTRDYRKSILLNTLGFQYAHCKAGSKCYASLQVRLKLCWLLRRSCQKRSWPQFNAGLIRERMSLASLRDFLTPSCLHSGHT